MAGAAGRLVTQSGGQPFWHEREPQADDLVDPADFPEEGGPGDTLNASEGTDSDELRNDDGDIVVDPPRAGARPIASV
ncbi:hypothetical protein I548_2429 [Mycobacterium intracellulare]|nr:hypothetical protein I548_2429 [Mycobacterium intracellulare]